MDFVLIRVDCDLEGRPLPLARTESLGKLTAYQADAEARCGSCQCTGSRTNAVYYGETLDLCHNCIQRDSDQLMRLEPARLSKILTQ